MPDITMNRYVRFGGQLWKECSKEEYKLLPSSKRQFTFSFKTQKPIFLEACDEKLDHIKDSSRTMNQRERNLIKNA